MLYEIEYKFLDELKGDGWRVALVVVYTTGTPLGDTIQHALGCVDEDGDTTGLDKLLKKQFGVVDEDVSFYFDRNGIKDESLVLEIEHNFDIVINRLEKL